MVAVRDASGVLSCSPFHVKLNKAAKKGDSCRIVKLSVNSKDVALSMKLGGAGEAFFVERTNEHTNEKVFQNSEKLFQDNTVQRSISPTLFTTVNAVRDATFIASPHPLSPVTPVPVAPSGNDFDRLGLGPHEVR